MIEVLLWEAFRKVNLFQKFQEFLLRDFDTVFQILFGLKNKLGPKSVEGLLNKWRFVFVPAPTSDQMSVSAASV